MSGDPPLDDGIEPRIPRPKPEKRRSNTNRPQLRRDEVAVQGIPQELKAVNIAMLRSMHSKEDTM